MFENGSRLHHIVRHLFEKQELGSARADRLTGRVNRRLMGKNERLY